MFVEGKMLLNAVSPKGPALSKEDKEALRQKELKQMKAKYGLQVSVTRTSTGQFKLYPLFYMQPITAVIFCK